MSLINKLNDAFLAAKTTVILQDEILNQRIDIKLPTSMVLLADSSIQVSSGKPAQMICGLATQTLVAFDKTTLACITNGLGSFARMKDKGLCRVALEHLSTTVVSCGLCKLMSD